MIFDVSWAIMDQKALVSEICDEAESFLAGVTKLAEAKAGIAEWLTIHHSTLAPEVKNAVITEAMDILESEGFFEAEAGAEG